MSLDKKVRDNHVKSSIILYQMLYYLYPSLPHTFYQGSHIWLNKPLCIIKRNIYVRNFLFSAKKILISWMVFNLYFIFTHFHAIDLVKLSGKLSKLFFGRNLYYRFFQIINVINFTSLLQAALLHFPTFLQM